MSTSAPYPAELTDIMVGVLVYNYIARHIALIKHIVGAQW